MSGFFQDARAAAWHFRRAGISGLLEKQRRVRAEKSAHAGGVRNSQPRRSRRGRKRLRFDPYVPGMLSPRRADLTVAVILDEFSLSALQFEWQQVALSRAGWRDEIASSKPDLLFVESAWAGNGGQWRYQLTGESGPKADFLELMDWCRSLGIPTVFWNKEDPPHYADFLEAAKLFDYVFTSDSGRVASYVADLGHDRVGVLQFAAQPALHNPVRPSKGWRSRDVAFAGMYFAHKYPERREQMQLLLGGAYDAGLEKGTGLDIFSRHSGADANYRFPPPYDQYVAGSLPYSQMLTAYKTYKVFLNVNSVVDSPSMCARRIFEITAAGTSVVSTSSEALATQWKPGEQFIVSSREGAKETILALTRNPQLSDRQVHRAQRRIWSEHTYAHRVEAIIEAALPAASRPMVPPSVSLLVATMRPHQLEHVFRTVGSFEGPTPQLVLCTHGFQADSAQVKAWSLRYGLTDVVVLARPGTVSLGECLNACVAAAGGQVLSKMDDDDFYSPNYLRDLVHALQFSRADVVGKHAHYMYVAAQNATLLRFADREHRFTTSVMGPTITARREVFEEMTFAQLDRGEDTQFLKDVRANGGQIYASDRFNYTQFRGVGNHTWKISDTALLGSGEIVLFGNPEEHIAL
ncbi:glycosyltransferase family protein [Arthrobacter sp. zg-Y179]|uniref:glycosyltransferase family protein n=1 Tax=Arthrobacter sp. zg-Y179 TaxID=2894188 RepID=UPI001E5C18F1|nr:glycosyltransferase [Arthrobacter sp. zg-Y179]MCC9174278.1 glycosyltransferase [Arthrobacter sp. zg-Y179]